MMNLRKRAYEILELASPDDKPARLVNSFILALILVNLIFLILETVENIYEIFSPVFKLVEIFSVLVFSVEYIARMWSAIEAPGYQNRISGRIRFSVRPLLLIDLISILPFYLPLSGLDLRFIRSVRLFRIFRIAKLGRYSETLKSFGRVLVRSKEQLVTTVCLILFLLLISSSLMYFVERDAQPEAFSSIPSALWWGVITLTTVGYGDVAPITTFGKILGSVIAVLGIGLFALPTGVLGAAFVNELMDKQESMKNCPHCGERLN